MRQVERLDLVDITGRIVASQKISNQANTRFNVPGLAPGLYYLKITKSGGEQQVIKMVRP